jgi:hypothetical protein
MAMLAEIYMLRLEAAARAAKETARFIPITLPVVKRPNPLRTLVKAASVGANN